LFRDSALVTAVNLICQGLGVATALLFRVFLDPTQMGIWQGLKLFLNYANYANLGISKGATRELTIALGRGDPRPAERGLSVAFTFNTISSGAYALVLIFAACVMAFDSGSLLQNSWSVGLLAVALMVVVQRHVTFLITILRARQQFAITACLSLLDAALTLAVGAALVAWWGLEGLFAATLVVLVASAGFLHAVRPARLRFLWDAAESRRLVAIGGPILLFGVASALFHSLDRLMILAFLPDGAYQLGCYSVALLVAAQLYGFANVLTIVVAPRYGELFGRSGDSRAVARLAARTSEPLAAMVALAGSLAIVAGAPLLSHMLPDYRAGLAPLVWLVPGTAISALALPLGQLLIATGRERRALWPLLAALAVAAAGNYLAIRAGFGLIGVAAAMSISFLVHCLLTALVALAHELTGREFARYTTGVLFALAPCLLVAIALVGQDGAAAPSASLVAARSSLVVAVWLATTSIGWRFGGWHSAWKGQACAR